MSRRRVPRRGAAQVNVALIGYAFMGKAHSNAYRQVAPFLSPTLTPRMKVICGRTPSAVRAAAREYGWDEAATDWQEVVTRKDIDIVDISTPGDSHMEIAIAAARAGQGRLLREAAGQYRPRRGADAGRGREGRRAPHDLPQLPPRAGGDAGETAHRRRAARRDPPLPRHLPAGLDHRSQLPAGLASRQEEGGIGRARRHRRALDRPGAVSRRRDQRGRRRPRRRSSRCARCPTTRRRRGASRWTMRRSRSCGSRTARSARSRPRAWRRGARTTTASRSTAAAAASRSTWSG